MFKKPKIVLIGGGNIGSTLAHLLVTKQLGDIVIFDIIKGIAKGKALDIAQSAAIEGIDIKLTGTDDYKDIADADVIIVTAGIARKPQMTREDMLLVNADVIKQVAAGIKTYASEAFVIVITNPLDIMSYVMFKESGLNHNMIVGMAGVLDGARLKYFLAEEFKVSVKTLSTTIIGAHNDSMLPLIRYSTVNGVTIPDLIEMGLTTKEKIDSIVNRTRNGGAEIVSLLKTASAYYAPAASAIEIAESYLRNQRKVLICSTYINGKYGVHDLYLGLPVVIGNSGVEKIIELDLTPEEKVAFTKSADGVKELIDSIC